MDNALNLLYTRTMLERIKNILLGGLLAKLKIHHSVYRLPCTSEYLEELIADTLSEEGFVNDWKPNRSHSFSVDMNLESGMSISVKSGTFDPDKGTLVFSGSRLGKHQTLDKMVESVMSNSAEVYVCLAKAEKDWASVPSKNDVKTYYLFIFNASNLNYELESWSKKESKNGFYYAMERPGITAMIRPSMSYQLWTTVHTDVIGSPTKLEIL